MEKAVILYNSKTGTTKKYAEEIGKYLETKAIEAQVSGIQTYREEMLDGADYLFLGCWTSGLMVILQHPEKVWVDFAVKLPNKPDSKIALFTTYKLLTGTMFKNMTKPLKGRFTSPALELKSRNGFLSEKDKTALDQFIT
jgi:flavodoxin